MLQLTTVYSIRYNKLKTEIKKKHQIMKYSQDIFHGARLTTVT